MKKISTLQILLIFFCILSVAFLAYYYYAYKQAPRTLPIYGENATHRVGTFAFTNQEGKVITNTDMDDKIYVVNYFFTTCKGICPKMNDNMRLVYEAYRGNNEFKILSHTVDPVNDTVDQLKRYAQKFDADPTQWMFLTGRKDSLYSMALRSYLVNAVDDTSSAATLKVLPNFIHAKHAVLVDKDKRIRGSYDATDLDHIKKLILDIKELQEEYRREGK
jgi:protein SCO1/2